MTQSIQPGDFVFRTLSLSSNCQYDNLHVDVNMDMIRDFDHGINFDLHLSFRIFLYLAPPSTRQKRNCLSVNNDRSAGIEVSYALPECPNNRLYHSQKVNNFQTMILQRYFFRFDVDDKSVNRYTLLKVVQQLLCHLATLPMTTYRWGNYNLGTNVDVWKHIVFTMQYVFWKKVSVCHGESLFLSKIGIYVKNILLFNVSGTTFHNTSVPTCMHTYSITRFSCK
jgi:hypothetical protein